MFPAGYVASNFHKDAENKVASIRSVHGKRLTSSVPLEELFNTPATDVRHLQLGRAQRCSIFDHRSDFTAHDSARRSSVGCHVMNEQPSLARLTQRAADDNSVSSSGDQVSSVSGITSLSANSLVNRSSTGTGSHVWPAACTDHSIRSCTAGIRQLEAVSSRQPSVSTVSTLLPSTRSEFGRRRRPVSVMEFTSRMLPAPPPPPPARKPHRSDRVYSQMDSSRTGEKSNPRNFCSDEQLQQPAVAHTDEDVMLCGVSQQNESESTHGYNTVAVRSSKSFIPVAHSTDMMRASCHHTTDSSVLQTSAEALYLNAPNSQYAVPTVTVGPLGDNVGKSEAVCTDVGSFAQRLSQLKTLHERPGHHLQADAPANSTCSTAGEHDSHPCDVVTCVTHSGEEPRLYKRGSVIVNVPPSVTARVSEVGDLSKFSESLNFENNESAVGDEVLLPPPPEFDDDFNATAISYSAVSGCHSHSVRDSNVDEWSADEVCNWLDAVGLRKHCASFRMKDINGVHLRTFGRSELIALGMTDVHDRMKFERAVSKAQKN